MKTFIINFNDSGQRVDKFITKVLPKLPKSMMYRLIRKKDIKVNGKRCEISTRLECGDKVTIYVKDEFSVQKQHDMTFLNVSADIEIVYEDKNIIIINKPVGIDSHSGSGSVDTVIDRIKHYLYNKKEYLPEDESSFAPSLCSRLDRNTCGLITAAKNSAALREINLAIREGLIHKMYHCVTAGILPQNAGILTAYHKKEESGNIVKISDSPLEGYKIIKTGYKVIGTVKGLSLAEITLYTGRTHQIRAHLAHIGAPILGDSKYGNPAVNKKYNMYTQALCAFALRFELPESSSLSYLNKLDICAPVPSFEKMLFN